MLRQSRHPHQTQDVRKGTCLAVGLAHRAELDADVLAERTHTLESRISPKITTEFFELAPPDPQARVLFSSSRNTYLAYLREWSPELRTGYTVQPIAGGVIGVELAPMGEAYRKASAFANFLGLVRMAGVREHAELLGAMIARFLSEDGGL